MPSLTAETSPYDVLSPVSTTVDDSSTTDNSTDDVDNVDDANVDDTDSGADDADADSDVDADAADADGDDADGGDPEAKAAEEAAAKAEDAQWKAKDGNLPAALKEIIAANPGAAKRLKEMYFTNQRLMKFGPAAEIKKMKEAIDNVGGVEKLMELKGQIDLMGGEAGFQEAQQELGAWRELDNKWQNDAPGCADHLFEANALAAEKLAPVMFGKLGEVNPELYNYLGAQIITQTLANDGTITDLLLMKQALAAGDTKLAQNYFTAIESRIAGLQNMSKQAPKSKAVDPKAQAWETEKKGYEQKEIERFQGDVLTRNEAWMNPKINTELASYLNGAEKKLSPNTLSRLDRAVKEEIWHKHLKTNPTFMKAKDKLYQQKDLAGVERLYKQYSDSLFPTVVRQIAKEFSLAPGAKRAAGAPQSGSNKGKPNANAGADKSAAGFKMVDKYPNPALVDSKKTTFDMKMKDQYILKDGTKVQVKPLRK
jgi:hypothetical protein